MRPFRQLAPLLSPAIRRRLAVQAPPRNRPVPQATTIRKVVVRHPQPDACEAVVLVERDRRVTALSTSSLPTGYRPRDAFDEVAEEEARLAVSAG